MARRITAQTLRLVPPASAFAAIERFAPRWARLYLRAGGVLFPRSLRDFPEKVAPYLGPAPGRTERARLVEARLVFLLIRAALNQALLVHGIARSCRLLSVEVGGAEHLDAALAERRGLVLVSAHFGLPPLIRLVLESRGARVIGVGGSLIERVDVATGCDVWARARALRRLRAEVTEGRACLLLADVPRGRHIEAPFLRGRIPVAPGAFGLARAARSPLLPVFAVHAPGAPRFRVTFGPPLPLDDRGGAAPLPDAAAAFARCYEAVALSHPAHLFGYDPIFNARRVAPRASAGDAPRSRSARP